MPARRHTFRFSVLGWYPARLKGNETHVTVNMTAGHDDNLAYAGTLTMSESEWKTFVEALKKSLHGDVEVVDQLPHHVTKKAV
jgi:hypothetical protein